MSDAITPVTATGDVAEERSARSLAATESSPRTSDAPDAPTVKKAAKEDWLDRLTTFASRERYGLIGLSVVRILFGVLILTDLLIHIPDRRWLWGPESWYTAQMSFERALFPWSVFRLNQAGWMVELVMLVGMVLAIMLIVGYRTRIAIPLMWLIYWSLNDRNPMITNGGDNVAVLFLVFFAFTQMDAYFSVNWWRRRREGLTGPALASPARRRSVWYQILTVFHNAALLLCIIQVCILYITSSLYKVNGAPWFDGTALYYILQVKNFQTWPELTNILLSSGIVLTVITYMTVLVQLAFPFSLLNRRACHIIFVPLVMMHLGIGLLMGLPIFSAYMIAGDLLVFSDGEWRKAWTWFTGMIGKVRNRFGARSDAEPLAEAAS